jgi:hypothetical protein
MVTFIGMTSLTLTGVVMSKNEITVGHTLVSVDDGNTKSFEATTYKTKSVKEVRVSMQILQQPRSKQDNYQAEEGCSAQNSEIRGEVPSSESNFRFSIAPQSDLPRLLSKQLLRW